MNDILSKLRQSRVQMFWPVVILLILVAGAVSIVMPMKLAQAKKRLEPEVTVHPENGFSRTLCVVGDVDYKPFSYLLEGSPVPRG